MVTFQKQAQPFILQAFRLVIDFLIHIADLRYNTGYKNLFYAIYSTLAVRKILSSSNILSR